ncbi:MAG: hypothetical protein WKF75_20130 [Singulisphaera sp.]
MMTPRFSLSPRPAASGLALIIVLAYGTIASAQGHTPDPYRPYNSMYEPYVFPTYPRADGYFPNQGRLEGRSGPSQANQFQNFLDETPLGANPSGLTRSAGAGTPYYRAHRRVDPRNRPNNSDADRLFREKQEDRDVKYFEARSKYQEALNERDPQKRARLIKEYAAAKRLAERDFQRAQEPSAPGPRTAVGSQGPPSTAPDRYPVPEVARPRRPPLQRRSPRGSSGPAGYRSASFVPSASRPGGVGFPSATHPLASPSRERVSGSLGPVAIATPQAPSPAGARASVRAAWRAQETDDLLGRPG